MQKVVNLAKKVEQGLFEWKGGGGVKVTDLICEQLLPFIRYIRYI